MRSYTTQRPQTLHCRTSTGAWPPKLWCQEPAFSWFASVRSKPAWMQLEELKFTATNYVCCTDTDRTTVWNFQMEIVLQFQGYYCISVLWYICHWGQPFLRLYLWWSLCTLYWHARQVRVTVGDSGLCSACVFWALINSLVFFNSICVLVWFPFKNRSGGFMMDAHWITEWWTLTTRSQKASELQKRHGCWMNGRGWAVV